jgi:DNA-binding FrmR family transcriptional regulator
LNEQDIKVRDRLRRVEGQVHCVIKMLVEGRSCEEVVTQLVAVRAAVGRATEELITSHIDECLTQLPPEQVREQVARAVKLLGRVS